MSDPIFWKRFSMAVHNDEEQGTDEKGIKKSDKWLSHVRQKNKGSYALFCYLFWALFFILIAAVIIAIVILAKSGTFNKIHIGSEDPKTVDIHFPDWFPDGSDAAARRAV